MNNDEGEQSFGGAKVRYVMTAPEKEGKVS